MLKTTTYYNAQKYYTSGDNDEIGSGSFLIRESKVTETDKSVPSQPKKTKVQIEEIVSETSTKHHQENASPVKPTQGILTTNFWLYIEFIYQLHFLPNFEFGKKCNW